MHNGEIAEFQLIKRNLQAGLSDEVFNVVQGNTGEFTLQYVEVLKPANIIYDRFWMGICSIPLEGVSNVMALPFLNLINI